MIRKYIAPNLKTIEVAKSNNRSVLASIQGLKKIISYSDSLNKKNPDQYERFILNDRLNNNLCKCSNTGAGDYTVAENFISSDLMKLPVPEENKSSSSQKAGQKSKATRHAYQLYAELCGMEEKVWRRFLIPSNATMEYLAFALMAQFNMDGSHLYSFKIPQREDFQKLIEQRGFSMEDFPDIAQLARNIEIVSDYNEDYENYSEWLGVKTLDFDSFDADKINADMKNKIKLFKSMWYEE